MKYEYEDILELQLTFDLLQEFIISVATKRNKPYEDNVARRTEPLSAERYRVIIKRNVDIAQRNDYKNRPEYLLTDSSRDRAIAAMEGATSSFKAEILSDWIKCAEKMTDLEKVMYGWYKV